MYHTGRVEVKLYTFYTSAQHGNWLGQLHAPAALFVKQKLPVHIGREDGWDPDAVWVQQWRREKSRNLTAVT